MSIVQIAQQIKYLRQAVNEIKDNTQERITQISSEVKFNPKDNKEFNDLLNEIKQDILRKLHAFYEQKVTTKTSVYQQELSQCSTDYSELQQQILEHQEIVKQKIDENLQKRQEYDKLSIRMVVNYEKLKQSKKFFRALKQYAERRRRNRQAKADAYEKYQQGLQTKVFYYWRSSCHKSGYQKMLVNQATKEIKNIQSQFIDIIKILKSKIAETEEQIQIKKNAKAEFSYNLSRNLLKTISNLSMEVMSLHQVTIKDNQINNDENTKFLKEVNTVIQSKINNIISIAPQSSQETGKLNQLEDENIIDVRTKQKLKKK